jgi:GT2 family glycosyltransferase
MMVSIRDFYKTGCFNENFQNAGWDVDLCLRLIREGKQNIYTPFASIKSHAKPIDWNMLSDWDLSDIYTVCRPLLKNGDPYFNPNYDYAKFSPVCAAKPYSEIELNPFRES